MAFDCCVRLNNATLNVPLVDRLRAGAVPHAVAADGIVRYSSADDKRVENGPLQHVRDAAFPSWQLRFSPADAAPRYRAYMAAHRVPFEEQWADGQPCFLLPRQYRPHRWQLVPSVPEHAALTGEAAGTVVPT